jgi:multisubunit Na+/H+ antiporter MnhG subunit
LGVDLLALIMAGFVGIPMAILGVCLALIGILFFAAVGMAVTGIGLLTLPVLAILLIPGAIANHVDARRARDGDELPSTRSPLQPHRQASAPIDVRRIGLQRQRACR